MERDLAFAAANALRSEIAALDEAGVIAWANDAWASAADRRGGYKDEDLLAAAGVGTDLLRHLHSLKQPGAAAIAKGITDVLRGVAQAFEQELLTSDGRRHWLVYSAPLSGPRMGAVVVRSDISARIHGLLASPPDPTDLPERIEQLSPRERDVLRLMVRGFDNRQIAAELGIAYTTVRSHTQSLMEKLGARSRLQAVARASRSGIGVDR